MVYMGIYGLARRDQDRFKYNFFSGLDMFERQAQMGGRMKSASGEGRKVILWQTMHTCDSKACMGRSPLRNIVCIKDFGYLFGTPKGYTKCSVPSVPLLVERRMHHCDFACLIVCPSVPWRPGNDCGRPLSVHWLSVSTFRPHPISPETNNFLYF